MNDADINADILLLHHGIGDFELCRKGDEPFAAVLRDVSLLYLPRKQRSVPAFEREGDGNAGSEATRA